MKLPQKRYLLTGKTQPEIEVKISSSEVSGENTAACKKRRFMP
jgi:hypothetical protein